MDTGTNLLESTVADVLRRALSDADSPSLVNPDAGTIAELVDIMADVEGTVVRVLAPEATLKETMADFKLAAVAADHVETDRLALRAHAGDDNTLLVTDELVVAIVAAGDRVAGLSTGDDRFVGAAIEEYDDAWAAGDPFTLRTPAMSRVRETLAETLGADTLDDFDAVLASLEAVRGDDGLDEVTISLLVAARNEKLLYDVSKWGEDVGIASKATFSRTKTSLEEAGLVETETVPIDVGRPRLRLLLADDRLRLADADEFAAVAADRLADA